MWPFSSPETRRFKNILCIVCGTKVKDESFDLPGIRFDFLEGHPFVCERCVCKVLTNKRPDWGAHLWIKDNIING